tara:strand:- start:19 stop:1359 length:1341 start_codon:yes stop_codon:yes gene_type:complete
MKKIILVLIPIIFVVISCSSDSSEPVVSEPESENPTEEEPIENEIYFTLNVDNNYYSENSESWLVVNDANNGDVLDYIQIDNGASVHFEKPMTTAIHDNNISLINVRNYEGNTYISISTFSSVSDGSIWNLVSGTPVNFTSRGNAIGALKINANNLNSPASYTLSNKYGSTLSGGSSETKVNQVTNIEFENIPLYQENRYLFSIYDTNGDAKYKFLDDLTDGETITFNSSELQSYDEIVPLYLPDGGEYFCNIVGFEENQAYNEGDGYLLNLMLPFDNDKITSNNINLGYLNTLDKYITTLNYTNGNFDYLYLKYGDRPVGFQLADIDYWNVDVTNNAINNFQYNGPSSNSFNRQSHHFQSTVGTKDVDYVEVNWNLNQGKYYYGYNYELPEEILNRYPNLEMNNLNYQGSSFYLHEYSYLEYIDAKYEEHNPDFLLDKEIISVKK